MTLLSQITQGKFIFSHPILRTHAADQADKTEVRVLLKKQLETLLFALYYRSGTYISPF